MPDFKKNKFSSNSRPFNKGGARDFGPKELYDAECNNCHKMCQVPFRPNGKKPVYCTDCFKQQGGGDENRFERRPFEKRSFDRPQERSPRHEAPAPDRRIDDLKRQMDAMQASIDRLASLIENSNRSVELGKEVRKHVPAAKPASAPAKSAAKSAPKTVAKKAAAPAKKVAKKTKKA